MYLYKTSATGKFAAIILKTIKSVAHLTTCPLVKVFFSPATHSGHFRLTSFNYSGCFSLAAEGRAKCRPIKTTL